jgi:hypothetical protein
MGPAVFAIRSLYFTEKYDGGRLVGRQSKRPYKMRARHPLAPHPIRPNFTVRLPTWYDNRQSKDNLFSPEERTDAVNGGFV